MDRDRPLPGATTGSRRSRIAASLVVLAAALGTGLFVWTSASGRLGSATGRRPGCGSPRHGSTQLSFLLGTGREMALRTAIVHVPSGYTGSEELPLVLNMHGSGSSAAGEESLTDMDATSNHFGFIVVYPQAIINDGPGYDWNVPGVPLVSGEPVPLLAPSDVTFLTGLVGIVSRHYCVDPNRVYATGFSGGARIASQLACDSSTTFAAVAAVSGLRFPSPCKPARPVPILTFHGTADPIEPYRGSGTGYWTYSVPKAAQDWALEDGCGPAPAVSHPAAGVSLTRYSHCRGTASVELYTIKGEGHQWPGGPRQLSGLVVALGPQSDAINADDVIWAFFASHPMH